MATSEFVCPECGVTARSQKQLAPGTAIRCPGCKVVFKVGESRSAAPASQKSKASPAVRETPAAAPPPKPDDSRSSVRRRRPDDEDDDRDDRPRRRKKAKKSNTGLILIVGGAVALLVIVGLAVIVGVVVFAGKGANTQVANNNNPSLTPIPQAPRIKQPEPDAKPPSNA